MAIADGEKIAIKFTQPLVGDATGNETKFTVSFDEYNHVPGGSLTRVTRPVTKSTCDRAIIDRQIDLQSGVFDSTVVVDGVLRLGGENTRTAVITLPEIAAVCVDKYNNTADSTSGTCIIQGSNSWWYRTFLKYDTSSIPSGANIVRATMHVYCNYWNDNGGSGTTNISRVTADWTESSVTNWSNQPPFTSNTYLPSDVSPPKVGEWGEWDVTSLVKEWANGMPNYGLHIKNNNEGDYRYNWEIFNRRGNGGSTATYITVEYELVSNSRGVAVYDAPLPPIINLVNSTIEWSSNTPNNTSVEVETSIDDEVWTACVSGAEIPSMPKESGYSNITLRIKVTLRTDDEHVTPSVENIRVILHDSGDSRVLTLIFAPGTPNSIQRAAGDITVAYDGSGTLRGLGGPVLAFERTFTPSDLDPKNNPHTSEHLEIVDIVPTGKLTRIRYIDTSENEHIELVNITVTAALTAVDDI